MTNLAVGITRSVWRRIGWNGLGLLLALAVMTAAGLFLYRTLSNVNVQKVFVAARETSAVTIIAAASCVAFGYLTLTFYDFFSLHAIGRPHVPYRVAALASFTSYTIGHNVGLTVLTGGAIRLRIYSAWGLTAIDVAKIAFITGLTFWLGNVFVLGIGMIHSPDIVTLIDQLPPTANRAIGVMGLAGILCYLAYLSINPRVIGRGAWAITLPNARLTILQIAIGALDLGACSLAMYILMPAQPAIDFMPLMVAFVAATLLGFLMHIPGNLAIFEAMMLLTLPQFGKEALLAALLLFRLLYFVIPFALALTTLIGRETWLAIRK